LTFVEFLSYDKRTGSR